MTPKKELQIAYGLAVILIILGILSYCYAAFHPISTEQPVRLVYKGSAGKVIFDHKTHSADSGYGISCQDCHHHPEEDEAEYRACIDCHSTPPEGKTVPIACLDCHESDEVEDSEVIIRVDAFHQQCAGCHEEIDSAATDCGGRS